VASFADPIRGGANKLVLAEVLLTDMTPHPTNTRAANAAMAKKYASDDTWFGIEQEYTMLKADGTPLGFPAGGGFPAPQGPYYCGVGTGRVDAGSRPAARVDPQPAERRRDPRDRLGRSDDPSG